ncbi:MAG: hypothetical protein WB783_20010, partial [Arenicellales bacterium]
AAPGKPQMLPDKPAVPPAVKQVYLPVAKESESAPGTVYYPSLLGAAKLRYHNARYRVNTERAIVACLEIHDGPVPVDWGRAEILSQSASELGSAGTAGSRYAPLADAASDGANFKKWERSFLAWLRNDQPLTLFKSPTFDLISEPDETEGSFRARLQIKAREKRDADVKALRDKFDKKIQAVEQRVQRAQERVGQEQSQVVQSRIDTALSVGTAILGAFMGRKRSSLSRAGTAMRQVGRMRKESGDAVLAETALHNAQAELQAVNQELETELAKIPPVPDAQGEELEQIAVRPAKADISLQFFGIAWDPRARKDG